MTKLGYLHEPGVLHNLASRYELNDIYVSYYSKPLNLSIFNFLKSLTLLSEVI